MAQMTNQHILNMQKRYLIENDKSFCEKVLSLIFAMFLITIAMPSMCQSDPLPDVDSLGDIWVVTIDNTFSMRSRHGKMQDMKAIGNGTARRLSQSRLISTVNWETDRFLILKSGIREGGRVKNIDSEFIRHTDGILHKYKDKNDFAKTIGTKIANGDYRNYISFVSQMRLLSLHTALKYIESNGIQKTYRNIIIMTISDDAVDQHDQWSTDYRTLKECAPDKVAYLSNLARRYIYNPLNGWGGGDLKLIWSDENDLPHIWAYQYTTAEGGRKIDTSGMYLKVTARDGNHLKFRIKSNENKPCLCKIDSIRINGHTFGIDKYTTDNLYVSADYKNGIFCNDVTIYGKAQIDYTDSILGSHYRVIDFVQHSTVMPNHVSALVNTSFLLLILAAAITIIYVTWLLPRKVLFDIYDASGYRHRVRRGYRWQWNGNIIPLLALHIGPEKQITVLTRQDSKVETKQVFMDSVEDDGNSVLIASHCKISLSSDSVCHDSGKTDLEKYYKNQTDYPSILKYCYRNSVEYKWYKMQRSKRRIERIVGKLMLRTKLLLLGGTQYNHYWQDTATVSIECSTLPGKLFLIEGAEMKSVYEKKGKQDVLKVDSELSIRQHLLKYYTSTKKTKSSDNGYIIMILSRNGGWRTWDVVLTAQARDGQVSLFNAYWVYHYTLLGNGNSKTITQERKMLKKHMRHIYHHRIVFVNHWDANLESNTAMTRFNITQSCCKLFLGLASTEEKASYTPMYDPFKDGKNSSKQFMIKSDNSNLRSTNHLYCSFVPIEELSRKDIGNYSEQLSDTLIPFVGKDHTAILEIIDKQQYRIHGQNITTK